jgi:uncharacterized protein YbjT (DUF2867 family)
MILVTGATGNVGRYVVELLVDGGYEAAAVTRNAKAARLPDSAVVVEGDPSRPETLASVLAQTQAIFLNPITTSAPYQPAGQGVTELLRLAAEAGVERVVLLSGAAVAYGEGDPLSSYFQSYESAVTASGLASTFVQPGEFASNTLAWVPQLRSGDIVFDAYGEARTAPIHERDIAAVAVKALVDRKYQERAYVLDGTQVMTKREKLEVIADAVGRTLEFREAPVDLARQAMVEHGVPEAIAETVLSYQAASITQGAPVSDSVARVLDRPALTFSDWAVEHAVAFGR